MQLLQPFEDGRFVLRGELDAETRARLFELREQRPKPARDDKAIASWNGLALAAFAQAGRLDTAHSAGRVPSRPALDGRRPAPPHVARRTREGNRLPRGLRRRRPRLAWSCTSRAATPRYLREAHRLAIARRLALRRRRARRLLPDARRRRAAGRAQEGLRRPPDPERQRDARLRPAAVVTALGRRRARGARGVSVLRLVRDRLTRSPDAFGWLLVALDQHLAPHRELAIVGDARRAGRPAALAAAAPTDVVAFGPADGAIPLLVGRDLVDGRPPSTSASGSRAGRRSRRPTSSSL